MSFQEVEDEFYDWFDTQRPERIQVAFSRAVKSYDDKYISKNNTDEYLEDQDFMSIFTEVLNLLWLEDTLRSLEHEGLIEFVPQESGTLGVLLND